MINRISPPNYFRPYTKFYHSSSGIDKFLSRDYARSQRGTQVICDIKGKKYQRVSMIAAQCKKMILAPLVFEGTTDSKLFNHWLENCLLVRVKTRTSCCYG